MFNTWISSPKIRHDIQNTAIVSTVTVVFHFGENVCYSTPTNLQEGNVFSRVCLLFCPQERAHMTITHDALDLTVQPPPPDWPSPDFRPGTHRALAQPSLDIRLGIPPANDIWWSSLENCSDLFIWGPSSRSDIWWKHIAWRKWEVHVLLECFLVEVYWKQ